MCTDNLEKSSDRAIYISMITLVLVYSLPVSNWVSHSSQSGVSIIPHLTTFLFCFGMIVIFWLAQSKMIKYGDGQFQNQLWLNQLYLISLMLLPISAIYMSSDFLLPMRVLIFSVNLFVNAVLYLVLHQFSLKKPLGVNNKLMIGPLFYAAAAMLAFVHPYLSFFAFGFALMFYLHVLKTQGIVKMA